jgi:hypothetical protein
MLTIRFLLLPAQIRAMNSTSAFVECTRVRPFLGFPPLLLSPPFPSCPLLVVKQRLIVLPSAEKADITDPKLIEENLALGEHVKKGTLLHTFSQPVH